MNCNLCPNNCAVDKREKIGFCGTNDKIKIAKYYLHPFEESCISGKNGSGTIFFTGCSLKCVFCQNYELSRNARGKEITVKELADIFKKLEDDGASNINLVNPTHFSDKIIEALTIYKPSIPIVYNTHGYERVEILKQIFYFIDVFLPDIKFFSPVVSKRYTGKENYFEVASKAIEFMANKPLIFDGEGMMKSGCLVRHLVLPLNTGDSKKILDWFCKIKDKAFINVMSQYTPFGNIENFPELKRTITEREYEAVLDYAISLDIKNLFYQPLTSADKKFIPKWDY